MQYTFTTVNSNNSCKKQLVKIIKFKIIDIFDGEIHKLS